MCATKEGSFKPYASKALHALAPDLVIWECDLIVYRAGWLQEGIVTSAQLGTCGYLYETPDEQALHAAGSSSSRPVTSARRSRTRAESGIDRFSADMGTWFTHTRAGRTTSPTGARRSGTPPR